MTVPTPAAQPRTWTYADGDQFEASYLGIESDKIRVRSEDGQPVSVDPSELSEGDRRWCEAIKSTTVDLEGVGTIATPSKSHSWELAKSERFGDAELKVFLCKKAGSTDIITLTLSPQVATTNAMRRAHLKGQFNALFEGVANAGLTVIGTSRPEIDGEIADHVAFSVVAKRPDGEAFYTYALTAFEGGKTYTYQAMSKDSETAKAYISLAKTFVPEASE